VPSLVSQEWREAMIRKAYRDRILPKVEALQRDYVRMMAEIYTAMMNEREEPIRQLP
jgi:hypothetical protein